MMEKATPTTEMNRETNKEMSGEPTVILMLKDFTGLLNMLLMPTDSVQISGQTNLELMAKRALPTLFLLLKSHLQVSRTDSQPVVDLVVSMNSYIYIHRKDYAENSYVNACVSTAHT